MNERERLLDAPKTSLRRIAYPTTGEFSLSKARTTLQLVKERPKRKSLHPSNRFTGELILDLTTVFSLVILYLLGYTLVWALLLGWPFSIILHRLGFPKWWAVASFIPVANLLLIWILAVVKWPYLDNNKRSQKQDCH